MKTDFPMLAKAIDENANVLELEFLYALQCKKVSKMFLVLRNRKRDPSNKVNLLERMHLRNFALTYYKQVSYLLRRKKEIVSETVEIHLILSTFAKDWEKNENSEKSLLKALELLEHKQEWYRKDDELKMAVYLSLEHYYYCLERYEDALNCLDILEETLDSCLYREEYADIREMVSYERERCTSGFCHVLSKKYPAPTYELFCD